MTASGRLCLLASTVLVSGCAEAPLRETGALTNYSGLQPANSRLTKSRLLIHTPDVLAARSVRILPTTMAPAINQTLPAAEERALLANAIERSLCASLSDRFEVRAPNAGADLTVQAHIADVVGTDPVAAGTSKAETAGLPFVLPGVPTPRIPIGLGSLSVEAEARDLRGLQTAAMVWARGANSFTSAARVSRSGDAYELAGAFGEDFGRMLVTGKSPFEIALPNLPAAQHIGETLAGTPRHAACEAFGRSPGLIGVIGGRLGLPPDWTDKGAPTVRPIQPSPASD